MLKKGEGWGTEGKGGEEQGRMLDTRKGCRVSVQDADRKGETGVRMEWWEG